MRDLAHCEPSTRDELAQYLDVTPALATRRVKALVAEGYLEPDGTDHRGRPRWGLTRRGHALRMASAAKLITRATRPSASSPGYWSAPARLPTGTRTRTTAAWWS